MIETLNLNYADPNSATESFIDWFKRAMDRFFPIKCKSLSEKRIKSPWITENLISCIKRKHRYFNMVKQGTITREFYKTYRNKLTFDIRKSKQNYFQTSFLNAKNDPSKMWKLIHDYMNKQSSPSPSEIRKCDGTITNDTKLIVSSLNNSFTSNATVLRDALPKIENLPKFENFPTNRQSIYLNPTSENEITSIINAFENKNNSIDDFPFKILKTISNFIAPNLCHIFNSIITTGIYPDCLKIARVTPVFKNGDKHNPCNYRPISVLSAINKIFERLLCHRLDSFFLKYNIISPCQYGFIANRSINDAMFDLIGLVNKSLADKKHCLAIFFDFSKAFDTIDHNRLIMKLSRYGIRGIALSVIQSYLTNRSQKVICNGITSDTLPIRHGVPQGSILGPWLFNAYINDLVHFLQQNRIIKYADDSNIFDSDNNIDTLFQRVQGTIRIFHEWSVANYLSLNTLKTKYMLYTYKRFIGPLPLLQIQDNALEQVNSIKFLGVYLDSKLNFKEHTKKLKIKLSRLVGLTYSIGPTLDLDAARNFYFTMIHSIINYGIIFWGGCYKTDIMSLQTCQNKIIRNLFKGKVNHVHTIEIYKQLGLLKIADLHYLECSKAIYLAKNCNKYLPLNKYLTEQTFNHGYETRDQMTYQLPTIKSSRDEHNFLIQSIRYWNNINLDIRCSSSIHQFKKRLSNSIIAQYDR